VLLRGKCFVIMPFSCELYYFYLHLESHISKNHKILCERADTTRQSESLWDKIKNKIERADFVIADITGCKPNVLYELGYAHAMKKPSIILTRDSINDVPMDIRYIEIILQKDDPDGFFRDLDKAIDNIAPDVDWFYQKGLEIMEQFKRDTGTECQSISKEDFEEAFLSRVRVEGVPDKNDTSKLTLILLPLIIRDSSKMMDRITDWLSNQ